MELRTTARKVPKSILRTAEKYMRRMQERGERVMRTADGKLQRADGRAVGAATIRYMIDAGLAAELDRDLFGDPGRGQTIGVRE